jgi:predicted transcriptional regulator
MAKKVREPVQAYLDSADATLLGELAERTSSSKAEVIRQAIRRLAQELDLESRPGAGISGLMGALDSAGEVPPDLAMRHDEYLYGDPETPAARRR